MKLVTLLRPPLVSAVGSWNSNATPPLALAYLAASLRATGRYRVSVIDAIGEGMGRFGMTLNPEIRFQGLSRDEILARIDPETHLLVVSAMFSLEWTHTRSLLHEIKAALPHVAIVAGGEHISAIPEYILADCPAIDFCGLGEGEELLVELCDELAGERRLERIDGLVYRDEAGQVVRNKARGRIRAVDDVPLPAWDLVPLENYFDMGRTYGPSFGRNMPMLASRGCPYRCTFCSSPAMWQPRYYARSPEKVVDEIEHWIAQYGIDGVQFYDLTAIIKKEWLVRFANLLLERKLNIRWSLPSGTRSEALDEESLELLARTNCRYLVYAPESGDEATLQQIKKKLTLERMNESLGAAIRLGIHTRANIIIGFPDETRRAVWSTLAYAMRLALMGVDEMNPSVFSPYPGSEIFYDLVKRGELTLNDEYFDNLTKTWKWRPRPRTFSKHVGRYELAAYRFFGILAFYALGYLRYPGRIVRTLRNVFADRDSTTILEQRLKDWKAGLLNPRVLDAGSGSRAAGAGRSG